MSPNLTWSLFELRAMVPLDSITLPFKNKKRERKAVPSPPQNKLEIGLFQVLGKK
jgi:hypothetical protein